MVVVEDEGEEEEGDAPHQHEGLGQDAGLWPALHAYFFLDKALGQA